MSITVRLVSLILVAGLGSAVPHASDSFTARTQDQQAMIDHAYSRFELAGIDVPIVEIDFHVADAGETNNAACFGYRGSYEPSKRRIRLCDPSDSTLVHELAHAWIEATLDPDAKRAFLRMRGLDHWTEADEWRKRGAEQAAEILTWGLMERDISSRWLRTDGHGRAIEDRRLLRLGDVYFDDLIEGYEQLTGELPLNRARFERHEPKDESPEARRSAAFGVPSQGILGSRR